MTSDAMKWIPADLKAFQDCWEEITDDSQPYEVVMEDDFSQDYSAKRMCDILGHIAQRLTSLISGRGKTVNRVAVLEQLLDTSVLYKLEEYTTQMLVSLKHQPLVPFEFREFLFTRWLRSRFKVSNEVAFASLMKHVASDNFTLMERDRFIAIQSCTRGYAQAGRTASVHSNAWTQQGAMLRRMKEIEVALFERSVHALLDKENGFIVLDDELIASRAADVEQKAVSNRKRGKEGPVADCIACSMLSTCFGMRLRVKNDSSNVDRLLDSLLIPKHTECGIELAFDRGYGKLAAVLAAADRDLDVITIAGKLGSRHPYNTVEDWDAAMQKRRHRSLLTPETIRGLKAICGQWLIPSDNYLGCEVRVAKRQKPQSKTVYALALRDVFNRKEARKDLKFFVTQNHKPYTFVGVPKVQENKNDVLFSHTKASATRSCVEGMILQSAEPLTTGQRCADWFLMKSMLISGTMAGEIAQTVDLNTLRMSDEGLTNLLQDCIASWFGRHKGTAMMAAGSRNEEPTIQKLRSSVKFIQVIYDVGLLRWRNNRCIGVSPDAVCLISVAGKTQPVPCCLEIKSRLADTTVRRAESSATKHGSVVNCVFGDDTFKDCVPAENRAQVVHQALVTQFDYGLFVTSKVQGGEGSLVQVVVIEIPASVRMTHGLVLCAVATPLLGFLHGEHVVKRGVLIDDDFPPWATVPQRAILKSRAKLYFAHLKLITMADGTVKPTQPLLLYKHSVQHRYNKQKPGLDMNTELSDRVAFNSKGSFESKYVFRMLDAILVNSWRAHQAVFDVAPWMATLAEPPTLAQVRRKLHGAETIEDYVWYTSTASLAELASLKRSNLAIPNLRDDSPAGALFMQEFQRYRENNVWPMRRGALEKFIKDPFLKRLRTASFPGCEHKSGRVHELVNKASEGARRKFILCFVSKKDVPEASRLHGRGVSSNSSFMCTTCMVCLCKKKIGGSTAKSCYEVWHERKNLALEATKQRKRLLESREQEDADAEKRRKLSANANSQKKSPSKSPGPSQDAQFQEDREQPDEDELVEEDQEDELDGDNTDEQDIEEEEIGEQYYDDVYFSSDIDSLEDSTGEEEEDSK